MSNQWHTAMQDAERRYRKRKGIPDPKSQVRSSTFKRDGQEETVTYSEFVPDPRDPDLQMLFTRLENVQKRIGAVQPGQLPLKALKDMALRCIEALG